MSRTRASLAVLGAALAACGGDLAGAAPPQAGSLLGQPLYALPLSPERRAELEANLAVARREHEANPDDEEAIIWLGRRLAYLGDYRQALRVYTRGLTLHPDSYRLLRHRGHRHITVRELDDAVADLERAAALIQGVPDQVEPDGAPNATGIPRSTSHTNVTYHLALAHYLQGDFERAAAAWTSCAAYSTNDDMLCAALYWLFLALMRLERADEARAALAPVTADMEILENTAYHGLLLVFRGELDPAELAAELEEGSVAAASVGYGLGALALVEGRPDDARAWFRRVVEGGVWPAFGHIAAEAELARAP